MDLWQWLRRSRCLFALYHDWDVKVDSNKITHICKRCGKTTVRTI